MRRNIDFHIDWQASVSHPAAIAIEKRRPASFLILVTAAAGSTTSWLLITRRHSVRSHPARASVCAFGQSSGRRGRGTESLQQR